MPYHFPIGPTSLVPYVIRPVKICRFIFLYLLAGIASCLSAFAQKEPWTELSKGVYSGSYSNWTKAVHILAREPDVQAVVVPTYGGRIVHYSLHGNNLLLDVPEVGEKGAFHLGGHQADIFSSLGDLPAHPTISLGKADWQHKPFTLRLLSQPDPAVGVAIEKDVILDRETGDLALTQRMRNTSQTNVTYAIWSRTALKPGGFALLPLDKKSRFKEGWTIHKEYNGAFVFDGERYVSLQVRQEDELLVVFCDAEPTKVATDSTAEWIAYVYGDLLFVKYNPFFSSGAYNNGGITHELYFDRNVAELQALSPEVTLAPRENYVLPEKWTILKLPKPVRSFEDARKAAKKIRPSPFKNLE